MNNKNVENVKKISVLILLNMMSYSVFAANSSRLDVKESSSNTSFGVTYSNSKTIGFYGQKVVSGHLSGGVELGFDVSAEGEGYDFSEDFAIDIGDTKKGDKTITDFYFSPYLTYGLPYHLGLSLGATIALQQDIAEYYDRYHILGTNGHYYVSNGNEAAFGVNVGATYSFKNLNISSKYDSLLGMVVGVGYTFE
ncbi:hypothetical protein VIN01S_23010 [Vibrio inusitatus NBRC 102082]|uniref:Outer membrane protein beta-barrel domain-containing protein n=1 Tax=Vibrio inusitatus NBRC 102082 TaxID=1219070 RepID=A0A4Y3HWP9_9VIBR|nr:hypothetical protein [Vibrio inusitatus]GEA51497.1 hypothetical protein VIN01S_23010 [Vibrio inusitatus NBRC 102082]